MSPLAKLVSTVSEQTTGNRAFDPEEVDGKGDEDFFKLMKQRAADYFSADTDGDGMVNYDEFSSLIAQRADAKDFKQKAVKELFDALDVDKSGKLDLVEYIQWALRESLSKSKGKVLDLFRAWDADGSGQIDKDEFGVVLYSLGFKCSIRDVKKVFDALDKDGSGEIDYKEMNRALKMGLTATSSRSSSRRRRRRRSEVEDGKEQRWGHMYSGRGVWFIEVERAWMMVLMRERGRCQERVSEIWF